ncbi:hypothetical protein GQ600_26532 [Phytophthora cactorum]|nr:hypothetical protein GQ600_26532 [Phytophthora cactorum]
MAGRVFTVANESRYVVVRNVPARGDRGPAQATQFVRKTTQTTGGGAAVRGYVHDDSEFTDTVWVQYET